MFEHVIPDQDAPAEHAPAATETLAAETLATETLAPEAPASARATVGGVDYAIGGWAEYEIARRRADWDARRAVRGGGDLDGARPSARYGGRTYIYADDAVESIMAGSRAVIGGAASGSARKRGSALQRAADRLASSLRRMEDHLCNPDEDGVWECSARGTGPRSLTIPALTSADLAAFATDTAAQRDPDAMKALGDDITIVAVSMGSAIPAAMPSLASFHLPPLPLRAVPVSDDEAVLRLEAGVAPYVKTIEEMQAALAARLEAASSAVDEALKT